MGFLVLLAVGGVLGWVASIVSRGDDGHTIARYLAAGVVGALLVGALTSEESLMIGLSARTLLAGMAGSLVLIGALIYARVRSMG